MNLYVLKVWLIQSYASTKAAWCKLTVSGRELWGEHHVTVRVDGADLPQQSRPHRHAVRQLSAVLIERQQAHAVTVRRANEAAVRTEAQLFNVAAADISLLDVVRETQRAARRHWWSRWSSLLKLVHARPLRNIERHRNKLKFILLSDCMFHIGLGFITDLLVVHVAGAA